MINKFGKVFLIWFGLATLMVGVNLVLRYFTSSYDSFLLYWQAFFYSFIYFILIFALIMVIKVARNIFFGNSGKQSFSFITESNQMSLNTQFSVPKVIIRGILYFQILFGLSAIIFLIVYMWSQAWPALTRFLTHLFSLR